MARSNQFTGEDERIFHLIINNKVLLCVGVGKKKDMALTALRVAVRKALLSPILSRIKDIEVTTHDKDDEVIKAIIEAILIGTYTWKKYISRKKSDRSIDYSDKKYT